MAIVSFCDVTSGGGSTLGPGGHRPLQIVAIPLPPNLAVLLTHGGQLILRKISKFDATRCHILSLKCTKFDFRWGSAPQAPLGEAYITPPDPLAVFKRAHIYGREEEEGGEGREETRGREGKGWKGRGQPPPNILAWNRPWSFYPMYTNPHALTQSLSH